MEQMRNLKEEIEELGILSIEGSGLMTEKSIFAALDAIRSSNATRNETAEWKRIDGLQKRKAQRIMRAGMNG
jgi:hypothetical protein